MWDKCMSQIPHGNRHIHAKSKMQPILPTPSFLSWYPKSGEPKTYIIVEQFMCECVPCVPLLLLQPSGRIWSKWKPAFPYHIFCFVLISMLLRKFKELANRDIIRIKLKKKAPRMRIKVYTCLMIISQCYKFPIFFWHVKEFNATIFKHDLSQK